MKMLLPKSLPLLSIIFKTKPLLGLMLNHHNWCQLHGYYGPSTALFSLNVKSIGSGCKFFHRVNRLATLAAAKSISPSKPSSVAMSKKERRLLRLLPENVLKSKLGVCSDKGNLVEALQLYDEARNNGVPLCKDHYNMLLYLCSSAASGSLVEPQINGDDTNFKNLGMKRGFEIVQQMEIDKIEPNEATFTNTARLAAAMEDPEMAFEFVKKMKNSGISPRLRSYGPALFGFCNKGEAIRAYDVDSHMIECGVVAEEPELSALLKVSVLSKKHDKVYEMLHRMRSSVRQVSEPTAEVVENWFNSEGAANVGKEKWDPARIKKGVIKGGGGWHGQGWLGTGKWSVVRGHMDLEGVCKTCGEKLVCIDIDPMETENFARSLAQLASQREAKTNFLHFQVFLLIASSINNFF